MDLMVASPLCSAKYHRSSFCSEPPRRRSSLNRCWSRSEGGSRKPPSLSSTRKLSRQIQQRFTPNDPSSPPRPGNVATPSATGLAAKVFVGHSIYKGKAALTVEPRPPEFSPLDSGAFKISKEGFVLLQFAPAAAVRQYDWSRKQEEGKVRKVLKVEPLPDGSGHFFNLSVQNKLINMDERIYIPITKFIMPYLLGWHTFANSIKPEDPSRANNTANPRAGVDFEWNR